MDNKNEITVRQATVADLDALVPIFDSYRQFYRQPADLALARRFLLDRFQHNQSVVFMAVISDGSAVGFTQLFPSFSSVTAARIFILNDLFVIPSARRMGIGSQLLHAATDFAQTAGAVRLTLSTEVTNEIAQALYESEGWIRSSDFYVYNLPITL